MLPPRFWRWIVAICFGEASSVYTQLTEEITWNLNGNEVIWVRRPNKHSKISQESDKIYSHGCITWTIGPQVTNATPVHLITFKNMSFRIFSWINSELSWSELALLKCTWCPSKLVVSIPVGGSTSRCVTLSVIWVVIITETQIPIQISSSWATNQSVEALPLYHFQCIFMWHLRLAFPTDAKLHWLHLLPVRASSPAVSPSVFSKSENSPSPFS